MVETDRLCEECGEALRSRNMPMLGLQYYCPTGCSVNAQGKRPPVCEVCGERFSFPVDHGDGGLKLCPICRRIDWATGRICRAIRGVDEE